MAPKKILIAASMICDAEVLVNEVEERLKAFTRFLSRCTPKHAH
jgi:hypothetical protein